MLSPPVPQDKCGRPGRDMRRFFVERPVRFLGAVVNPVYDGAEEFFGTTSASLNEVIVT